MTEKNNTRKKHALEAFSKLIDIIDTLRSPQGCPWDRKQTSKSLKPYFVEETYEVLDAIDSGEMAHVKEELGDVLLQIMLHSQIAFEHDEYHIGDVIDGLSHKMIERHPHVFASVTVKDEAEVLENWEKIKAKKKGKKSVFSGIPGSLPSLMKAYQMGQKAGRMGFDWPDETSVRAKVQEELAEVEEAVSQNITEHVHHEIGDLLFAVTQWARHLGIEPEEALRKCCLRFHSRFAHVQKRVDSVGGEMEKTSLDDLELFWQEAKQREKESL